MIGLPAGTRVWLAAGVTDMRKGLRRPGCDGADGAGREPVLGPRVRLPRPARRSGQAAVVERRWLCLFAKRLERGRFVWPQAASGAWHLTPAQLSMLLEGIDWRRPQRTWPPELAA